MVDWTHEINNKPVQFYAERSRTQVSPTKHVLRAFFSSYPLNFKKFRLGTWRVIPVVAVAPAALRTTLQWLSW